MGFRESVTDIKGAGRDARVVGPNRSVDRAFYLFYTILLCIRPCLNVEIESVHRICLVTDSVDRFYFGSKRPF